MQTYIKTCAWLFLWLLLPWTALRATVGDPVQVGYLVDYHFAHLDGNWQTTGTQGRISDWDVDSKAGTINFWYWNYITITDSSTIRAIEMRKSFLPQTTGTISVEFKFLLPTKVDGMVWAIRSDRDNSLVQFSTSGGAFGYTNASGVFVPLLNSYNANQTYTVHVDLTLPDTSAVVYVNGVQLATGASAFRSTSLTQASQFYHATPVAGTSSEQLYYLTITKGYKLYERFTNATASSVPANWAATTAGGLASPQVLHGSNTKDTMSFRLDDTSTTAAAKLARSFSSSTGKLVFEFKWMLPVKVDGAIAQLSGGTASAVKFTTANSGLDYVNASGTAVELWPNYKANVWYIVRVIANPATQTADIYINGKLKGFAVPFNTTTSTFDNVLFTTSVANTGTLWVDDIYVYDFQAEPSDYVPAVQTVTSRGYMVGMQTFFSGWRDGHHCGWDWTYRYPNHDTYLGFYDGGNIEAMDWQLKWMAEAGINFFIHCWGRNTDGFPMKEPGLEYTEGSIHNAYFYAKLIESPFMVQTK